MRFFHKALTGSVVAICAATALQVGCSGGSGSSSNSSESTLTLSGTLGSGAGFAAQDAGAMAVDTSNLKIQAVAFTNPPTIVTADVNADGTFSVSLPGAKGTATSAYFLDKTDDSQVGVIVFEDTASKDMNGKASQSSSVVLGGSLSLGAISLGTDGKVKIPLASIANQLDSSSTVSAATAFDPTGVWYMKALPGSLPAGYETVGACGGHDGPCTGFPITLVRYTGKSFTPAAGQCDSSVHPITCASGSGTTGTTDRHALSIWGGTFSQGIQACGSKTGFTADEARGHAGINITTLPTVDGNAMSFGDYVFTKNAGFGGDAGVFTKDWMKTGATLSYDLQDCRSTTITNGGNNYNGWACRSVVKSGAWPGTPVAGPVYGWNIGLEGGGCYNTATNKPVNVTNWFTIGMGNCTDTDVSSTYGAGFRKNSCTYSSVDHDNDPATPAISLTCTHTGGQVTNSSGAPTSTALVLGQGEYLGEPTPIATAGATCASIGSGTPARTLAAYQCYAQKFWETNADAGNCARRYEFNWAATTPEDFARDNDRKKPKNAFLTNVLNYAGDGNTATMEDEEVSTITVSTGANSSTFCNVARRTVISFRRISDSRLLIDLRESGQMNSTSAACVGAAKDALAGKNVGGGSQLESDLKPQNTIFFADKTL